MHKKALTHPKAAHPKALPHQKALTHPRPALPAAWNPFQDIESEMRRLMSNVMEDVFGGNGHELAPIAARPWLPAVDVEETEKEYRFSFELPGLEKGDFHVDVRRGSLVVSGEKKVEKDEKKRNLVRREHYFGSFRRIFALPDDARGEAAKAAYKNGILRVTVPRSQAAERRSISVEVE